jgi:hypothetical protein
MNRKPRRPTPHATFIASMEAFRLAHREHDIESNRERLRSQVWPQPKRRSIALTLAEHAFRARKAEATQARGNLLGHMLGYSRAIESSGLPRWCLDVQQWRRKFLENVVVHRRPGAIGAPTAGNSFVVTEPYVLDEGSPSLPIWRRGLAAHKLCVMRLPDDWRINDLDCGLYQIFLVASPEMLERIKEFEQTHGYTKPRRPKPIPDVPPNMSNVLDIMSRRIAQS